MRDLSKKKLSFWTDGEAFTNLIHMFVKEGQFKSVYKILTEENTLPDNVIKKFFLLELGFKGDTRKSDLSIVNVDQPKKYSDILFYAIRMALELDMNATEKPFITDGFKISFFQAENNDYGMVLPLSRYSHEEKYENFQTLLKFIPFNEIINIIFLKCIKEMRYEIAPEIPNEKEYYSNGIILKDGTYILCDHQEHNELYPDMAKLGLSAYNWTECDETIHVSGGQISGELAYNLKWKMDDKGFCTEAQKQTLFKYRKNIKGIYGEYQNRTMAESLRRDLDANLDLGGKFNNLKFIEMYYNFNLPKFSEELLEGVEKQCIRTSPKYSLAGLLTSKFDITDSSIKEIKADFEKFKDVRKDNELHYFYQEFLDGDNGVCHYWIDEEHFSYSVSKNQGDIVNGKSGNTDLSLRSKNNLMLIAKNLATDLDNSVQIEFVIHNNKVYIVQLRLLENNHSRFETDPKNLENIIGIGQTFSKGNIKVAVEDILIVDSDTDSETLIGKKALIVKNNVEFSHVLALSKSLRIPSIFNMETLVLDGVNEVQFIAEGITAYITKIK